VTVSIAVVCEARADQQTGCHLADRVVCDSVDRIQWESLDDFRRWRGLRPNEPFLSWVAVKKLATERGIHVHGRYDGEKAAPDAHAATRALRLLKTADAAPDAIFLLRDSDGDPDRRTGLNQARAAARLKLPIVIGVAHPKRECWVLAGFEPNSKEQSRLGALREELHFDPREKAEQLTAKRDDAKRSAKRVLNVLTDGDLDRQALCWQKTDLAVLRRRGENSGLVKYLDEVEKLLVPLFSPSRNP
jgi:hypothetical protein